MRRPDLINKIAASVPRARSGWAPRDTWSADLYICRVVGGLLLHIAEHAHAWPGTEEFPTYEDWTAALRSHGERLVRYGEEPFPDETEDRQVAAQASLHWVADHLGSIWD